MATEILATASTAADSSDMIIDVGTPVTVGLKGMTDSEALVHISIKDDGGAYNVVGKLTSAECVVVIDGPGTYRFSRVAGHTCGVYSA